MDWTMWAMLAVLVGYNWAVVGLASALYWIDYDKVPLAMNVKGIRDAILLGPIQWWLGKAVQEDMCKRQGVQFPRLLLQLTAICLMVVLSGCMNISTTVQEDWEVPAKLAGADCSPIILGLGFGENSVTKARAGGTNSLSGTMTKPQPINHIRSVAFRQWQFLGLLGEQCVEVVGE